MYPRSTVYVLLVMVLAGSARSIVAKLIYQLGFEQPLSLTALYLFGQALSLVFYWIMRSNPSEKAVYEQLSKCSTIEDGQLQSETSIAEPLGTNYKHRGRSCTKTLHEGTLSKEAYQTTAWLHRIPWLLHKAL